ncbi:MAG TPA: methylmalonyl Co-A mutase-associated GTPase MeaB [Polyangia bacterium]|nr:methylmalonyl Co-A mutase-associated GTPase MeaB [Polyangia bacterium]
MSGPETGIDASAGVDAAVGRVLSGDLLAAAALMRALDDERPGAREALRAIYSKGGRAFVVGVTGSPGVGKSTLVSALVASYRARGERVAVVAVDPSSPFSGGALLGDRVRMNRHATDDGVFIRSLATRGHQGGLSRATSATVAVLDAAGFPLIFVETVGAGQAEVDVADAADAVVVVTAPGLGDEVQALKAGLLEIADLLVVNKGDREGADRTLADLTAMLALGARPPPTLLKTVAAAEAGVGELVGALELLRARPPAECAARRRRQAARQIMAIAAERSRARLAAALAENDALAATVDAVAARTLDPWSAADTLSEVLT